MADQTVIWTVLPNGITGEQADRRLRLSVYVSPRLTGDEPGLTLARFPDLLDWPARLRAGQVAFSVQARESPDAPPGQPVLATMVSPPPDLDLWKALFGRSTPVQSHQPDDLRGKPVSTYSVAAVHAQLKEGQQRLTAAAPQEEPSLAALGRLMTVSAAFTPMGEGEQVISPEPPPEDMDTGQLQEMQTTLAASMFQTDGVTSLSERVGRAVAHARLLAQRDPDTPVSVLPGADEPGMAEIPGGGAASELARLIAFERGPVAPAASAAAFPALAAERPDGEEEPAAPAARKLPPLPPPEFEFHRGLTLLSDHPALMRMLGLVIDLEVPAAAVPLPGRGKFGLLKVEPAFTEPLGGGSVSPSTAYVLEGGLHGFFAAAPDPEVLPDAIHGLLDLGDSEQFQLIQLDVHGGGLKLVTALSANGGGTPGDGGDGAGGVPALRTSGVSVVRNGEGNRLMRRVIAQSKGGVAMTNGEPPVVFAQDLVRGYRFDVLDPRTGTWRSLHQRVGTYTFKQHPGGPRTLTVHDEGAAQDAVTRPVGADGVTPDPDAEVYVHEAIATWQGWSLAAPRPGKAIADDGPIRVENTAPEGFPQLDVSFTVEPGSLPRLRFGQRYQFRGRTVDLAGNGLSLDEATELLEMLPLLGLRAPLLPADQDGFAYRRFEPVISPVLVPRARFAEGEAHERLVIRSRTGVGASQEAAELTNLVRQNRPDTQGYSATCERHLVPPKTSQLAAETHGLFDASFGTGTGFQQTYAVARKERGRLGDTSVVDITTGREVPVADPDSIKTVKPAGTGGEGYVVHRGAQLELPYLPDPMARGAALFGLPGFPVGRPAGVVDRAGRLNFVTSPLPDEILETKMLGGSTLHIGFGDAWPQRLPFRLVLAEPPPGEGEGVPPAWDAAARTLTVFLAQAEQRAIRLSSFISLDDLEQLGQWQWLLELDPGHPPDPAALEAALEGANWVLTPSREITLVHAVEQPLVVPEISSALVRRGEALTFAFLGAKVAVDAPSTARVDLLASWTEQLDPPGSDPVDHGAHVFEITIGLEGEAPEERPEVVPVATHDPQTSVLTIHAWDPEDQSGREYLARHEFGDTKARIVRYQALASSRFREAFPPEVTGQADRITLAGEPVQVLVPSSAHPAAPRVVSVLPTFEWSREVAENGTVVSRRTGGVRVYLERPWYSSGDGELLGVVHADRETVLSSDERLLSLITQWGADPMWGPDDRLTLPHPADFRKSATGRDSVPLEERPDLAVRVSGHEVEHDPERDQLYCDIAISGAPQRTYAPFVRLALARFQPNSLPGLELSRVVLADFVQVPSERTVTVTREASDPDSFRVVVEGLKPTVVALPGLPIEVTVEQRIPDTTDELGWMPSDTDEAGVELSPEVRFDWRVCGICRGLVFTSGASLGVCVSGVPHSPVGLQVLAMQPAAPDAPGQRDWHRCVRCQLLTFAGNPGSVCSAGGEHNLGDSDEFALADIPVGDGWDEWRRCDNCLGLVLTEPGTNSICPVGGEHVHTDSAEYVLDQAGGAPGQTGWALCINCGWLFFADAAGSSSCPAGGNHFQGDNPGVTVAFGPQAPGDHNWRWCQRCQSMCHQADEPGACPAGEGEHHDLSASGDYGIVALPYIRGVCNWRRCNRCQCLHFHGGRCPAGGDHDPAGSANYVLPVDARAPVPGTTLTLPLWSGRVFLPADREPGQFRIVVREFEPIATDEPTPVTGRLVYAETIEL